MKSTRMLRRKIFLVIIAVVGVLCINVSNRNYQRVIDNQSKKITELKTVKIGLEKKIIELERVMVEDTEKVN